MDPWIMSINTTGCQAEAIFSTRDWIRIVSILVYPHCSRLCIMECGEYHPSTEMKETPLVLRVESDKGFLI